MIVLTEPESGTQMVEELLLSGMSSRLPDSSEIYWFQVEFDDACIRIRVEPPGRAFWAAQIPWDHITRICFKANGFDEPDEIYIFSDERPESYLVPLTAAGGFGLWQEIIRRKAFDPELAIEAASAVDKLFCYPREKASADS